MEIFAVLILGILAAFTVTKPYEPPDGKPVEGRTLRERLRNQLLRF